MSEWIPVVDGKRPELPRGTLIAEAKKLWGKGTYQYDDGCAVEHVAWQHVSAYRLATPAKAEREPLRDVVCGCGKSWRAWHGKSDCTCGAVIDFIRGISIAPSPRWVRCDDRLPGDGREYVGRSFESGPQWNLQMQGGVLWCISPASDTWQRCWVRQQLEWLDEAPAREGQRSGLSITKCWNCSLEYHIDNRQCDRCGATNANVDLDQAKREQEAKAVPEGYLPRALHQRRAELANIEAGRNFRALFGGCRGRVG